MANDSGTVETPPVCAWCGAEGETITLSMEGQQDTPALCFKCFDKACKEVPNMVQELPEMPEKDAVVRQAEVYLAAKDAAAAARELAKDNLETLCAMMVKGQHLTVFAQQPDGEVVCVQYENKETEKVKISKTKG